MSNSAAIRRIKRNMERNHILGRIVLLKQNRKFILDFFIKFPQATFTFIKRGKVYQTRCVAWVRR